MVVFSHTSYDFPDCYVWKSLSCVWLFNTMDCSLPGSSVHGILQARILAWVVAPFSRGSSQPRDWTQVSCIAGRFFTIWATRESLIVGMIYNFKYCVLDVWMLCWETLGFTWAWAMPSLQNWKPLSWAWVAQCWQSSHWTLGCAAREGGRYFPESSWLCRSGE